MPVIDELPYHIFLNKQWPRGLLYPIIEFPFAWSVDRLELVAKVTLEIFVITEEIGNLTNQFWKCSHLIH